MKKVICLFVIPFLLFSCIRKDHSDFYPADLKCNNLTNPSGTNAIPDFGWIVSSEARGKTQSAWQVILDKDQKNLEHDNPVLWNSGKVLSDQTSWISYSGPTLEPANKYFWKVRIWDEEDKQSEWSKSASFITGLFDDKDWSGAKWIGYEEIPDSMLLVPGIHKGIKIEGDIATKRSIVPYFRKEFTIKKKVKEAFVFISGLGQYELYMNGSRIGDRFLSPGWTNYLKTCFYNTFDVTNELKNGPNAIGAIAGNGFYNINRERYYKLVITYGAPRLIIKMLIRYNDGTEDVIESNETWKTTPSPVTFASIFGGEDYDARLEQPGWNKSGFNDVNWNASLPVRAPGGRLQAESDYPLKVMQEFDPVNIYNPDSSIYVYDFGQNASGIIRLTVKGKRGQEVRLWPGELIGTDSLSCSESFRHSLLFLIHPERRKGRGLDPKVHLLWFQVCQG